MERFMKGMQALAVFLGTTAVAFANEPKEGGGGGYDAMAYVWFTLIGIILVWGVYDSFFRPID